MAKVTAIVPAAGRGRRMGGSTPKPFLEINGKPILILTLQRLAECPLIDEIIVVSPPEAVSRFTELVRDHGVRKITCVIPGGKERMDSVERGLGRTGRETGIVVIHDGVRPFVSTGRIEEVIRTAEREGAAILGIAVRDTLKEVGNGKIKRTVDRSSLWQAQTPQAFRRNWIMEGYAKAREAGVTITDDAAAVEMAGRSVCVVEGDTANIKITTRKDLVLAECIAKEGAG